MRERRNYLLILGAIAALLVGAVLLAVPGSPVYKKPTLGLDLQGGLEVVLRAVPQKGQSIDPQQMQVAQQVITQRTNASGLVSPNIAIQGGNEIVIQLAGVHDPAKAAKTIGSTGQLQMFDFETSLLPPTVQGNQQPAPLPSLYGLLKAVQTKANKGSPQSYYLFKTVKKKVTTKVKGKKVTRTQTSHPVLQGPAGSRKQLLLPYKNGEQPPDTQVLKVPANTEPVSCKIATASCLGAGSNGRSKSGEYWYLFKLPPALTGKDLVESGIAADVDPNTGSPIVTLQFTGHGSDAVQADHGGRVQPRSRQRGPGRPAERAGPATRSLRYAGHNAIVLDGELQETPYIDYTDSTLSLGIAGNAPDHGARCAMRPMTSRSSSRAARFRTPSRGSRRRKSRRRSARARSIRRCGPPPSACSSSRSSCSSCTASWGSWRSSASPSTRPSTTRRSCSST